MYHRHEQEHEHLDVAMSLMNVGNVLDGMGKPEEALVQHQKES